MVPFFPKIIANKGLVLYVVSLLAVSIAFNSFAMPFMWMLLGVAGVSLFFVLAPKLSKEWQGKSVKDFTRNLFWIAVLLRVVWVVFSYYFYLSQTGQPFEYGSSDAIGYHDEADWLAYEDWNYIWDFLFASRSSYSDSGYSFYLTALNHTAYLYYPLACRHLNPDTKVMKRHHSDNMVLIEYLHQQSVYS